MPEDWRLAAATGLTALLTGVIVLLAWGSAGLPLIVVGAALCALACALLLVRRP